MTIDCPGCGGSTEIQPSDRFVRCAFCDSMLYIELGASLIKTTFKVVISKAQINRIIYNGLREHQIKEHVTILSSTLFLMPFWTFSCLAGSYYSPAVNTTDKCIETYRIESGETEYLEAQSTDIEILDPDIFLDNALSQLKLGSEADLRTLKPSLLYVPFYKVMFVIGTTRHTAFIPAHTGHVLFSDLPAPPKIRMDAVFLSKAIFIYLMFFVLTVIMLEYTGGISASIGACAVLLLVLYQVISVSENRQTPQKKKE